MIEKFKDEIGKKYGHLTVLDVYYKDAYGRKILMARYKCDCGNEKETTLAQIRYQTCCGRTCACQDSLKNAFSVIGTKSGHLTAIEVISDKGTKLKCQCDCGNIVIKKVFDFKKQDYCSPSCPLLSVRRADKKYYVEDTYTSTLKSKPSKANKSGVPGVWKEPKSGKWVVYITLKGKRYNLGRYEDKEDAIIVRKMAEKRLFDPILIKYGIIAPIKQEKQSNRKCVYCGKLFRCSPSARKNTCSTECHKKWMAEKVSFKRIGKRFGHLVILSVFKKDKEIWAKCKCDCGNVCEVRVNTLEQRNQKTCGKNCTFYKPGYKTKPANYVEGTDLRKISAKPNKLNTSGVSGVCWVESRKRWQASIRFKGVRKTLGWFINKEDAIAVRRKAEEKYFKPILKKYGVEKE